MQPRDHHYIFGHLVLRNMFLSEPERFLAHLQREGTKFLDGIWQRIGQDLPKKKVLPPTGLAYDLQVEPDSVLAIVRLPPATEIAEAMLVGCHLRRFPPEEKAAAGPFPRFFTLEYGVCEDLQTPRTVFCEWTSLGAHVNYGDGPPAEFAAFAAAIRERVGASSHLLH
ncbi:MAG: hypothetical protein OZSIB_2952 [Candidatus Ozemobacter sibiricus]|jgi:hypothetical protein|uniref:Uncharacterized protein n=1 Tax=Candidatus Ozemobacter sibiricus TaxID=2268124 RepID=A0A367ZSC9_9BACT|nr:MAG: hypothetical protein OZSIB_2952 [Candidatus Ozemobacter sibiricus]